MSKTINFNVTDDVLEPFYAVELMFNGNIVTPYNVNIVSKISIKIYKSWGT